MLLLDAHPSLAPEVQAATAVGSDSVLRIGDFISYQGSCAHHHGVAIYAGLCRCGRGCPDVAGQTRIRIITAEIEVVRHVRCRSFEALASQPAVIPIDLRAAADQLRAERAIVEVSEGMRIAASGAGLTQDPHVNAWHPIAVERGDGGCTRRARPRCRRCVSAETVRALLTQ